MVGDVNLEYIGMSLENTNIFTKGIEADKLRHFTTDLGLSTPELPSLRGSEPKDE